jgi:hypothetical protein
LEEKIFCPLNYKICVIRELHTKLSIAWWKVKNKRKKERKKGEKKHGVTLMIIIVEVRSYTTKL